VGASGAGGSVFGIYLHADVVHSSADGQTLEESDDATKQAMAVRRQSLHIAKKKKHNARDIDPTFSIRRCGYSILDL